MPLPRTSAADIERHLDDLGVGAGDRLVVHSRLLSFGRIEGGVEALADALLTRIGPTGTVVVPAYTFDAAKPYDPRTSPGEGTGALSESLRQRPGAVRSLCPIHNHAGLGPAAELLRRSDPTHSMGPGSDFDLLRQEGFDLLLLGCGFTEGCTWLHHAEALTDVPYRHWQVLKRRIVRDDGSEATRECRYFARSGTALAANFMTAQCRMEQEGLLRRVPLPLGESLRCSLADLDRVAAAMLAADPHALVRRETS